MPHDSKLRTLSGRLRQILFSPKGGLEGLVLEVRDKSLQVSMDPGSVDPVALERAVGKAIEVQAQQDHSPKTRHGAHPVYQLRVINKLGGKPYAPRDREATAIRGVVAPIHYAKHGEPNGVILEDGEFVHTRPDGMRKLNLEIGAKVVVRGDTRMTVLGTSLIEASEVNGVSLGG
jgi:hypothetical protein